MKKPHRLVLEVKRTAAIVRDPNYRTADHLAMQMATLQLELV